MWLNVSVPRVDLWFFHSLFTQVEAPWCTLFISQMIRVEVENVVTSDTMVFGCVLHYIIIVEVVT